MWENYIIKKIIAGVLQQDNGLMRSIYSSDEISIVNANDRSFFWRLSILENLKFFCQKNNDESIISQLNNFKLLQYKDDPYLALSTGNKKKLSIIRALLNKPKILLFDEATSGLDIVTKKNIINELLKFRDRKGIELLVFTTHSYDEIKSLSNKVLSIKNGSIYKKIDVTKETSSNQNRRYYLNELSKFLFLKLYFKKDLLINLSYKFSFIAQFGIVLFQIFLFYFLSQIVNFDSNEDIKITYFAFIIIGLCVIDVYSTIASSLPESF